MNRLVSQGGRTALRNTSRVEKNLLLRNFQCFSAQTSLADSGTSAILAALLQILPPIRLGGQTGEKPSRACSPVCRAQGQLTAGQRRARGNYGPAAPLLTQLFRDSSGWLQVAAAPSGQAGTAREVKPGARSSCVACLSLHRHEL